ncbi:SDR family NAD(P)-dependent oxidoreductase [Desulfosporosinus fructosivorans]
MRLDGVHMLVTGAGKGIGRSIAIMSAAYGADISIVGRTSEPLLETSEEIRKLGRQCEIIIADVSDYQAVTQMVEQAEKVLGPITILVNNVGWDNAEPFWKNSAEFWDKVIDTNYKSVIYCSRAVLDSMMKNNCGKIINIASDSGRVGSSGETVYAGSKGAVIAFTKSLAREVARFNIKVNCVSPGPTDTPLYQAQPEKIKMALEKIIPLKRVALPEDVAGAVVFFASNLSEYITGQILSVSGGLTMQG